MGERKKKKYRVKPEHKVNGNKANSNDKMVNGGRKPHESPGSQPEPRNNSSTAQIASRTEKIRKKISLSAQILQLHVFVVAASQSQELLVSSVFGYGAIADEVNTISVLDR